MVVRTQMTMKNESLEPRGNPARGRLSSRPIEGDPEYAKTLTLRKFSVERNGESVFVLEGPLMFPCVTREDGTRVWKDYFPASVDVPTSINPGETLRYDFEEEFYIPPKEEIKVRWTAPRKGIIYKIEVHDMENVVPCVSLTGCSLCESTRHHRCTSCSKSEGYVFIDTRSGIEIKNQWVGSEMGINVEWETKEDYLTV